MVQCLCRDTHEQSHYRSWGQYSPPCKGAGTYRLFALFRTLFEHWRWDILVSKFQLHQGEAVKWGKGFTRGMLEIMRREQRGVQAGALDCDWLLCRKGTD